MHHSSLSRWLAILAAMLLATAPAFAVDTYYLFVFSNPVAGQEVEYNRWYNEQHAPDVVAVPGFVSAQRFVLNDQQLTGASSKVALAKYLILYRIVTDDLVSVSAEMNRRVQVGETKISPTFDRSGVDLYMYRALGPAIKGVGGDPASAPSGEQSEYRQIVFTVPIDGKEAEFNQWYSDYHAPEMAAIPGFVSAQRLILQDQASAAQNHVAPSKYAALFHIKTRDFDTVVNAFKEHAKGMVIKDVFSREQTRGYTYRAIGPVIDGDQVRRSRAAH